MTDHSDTPLISTGDWIDAAWLNQYIGDNFRAIFQGISNTGSIPYGVDANTVGELAIGTAGQIFQVNAGAIAPEWASLLRSRQGGSANDWYSQGSTNYTPGSALIQAGVARVAVVGGNGNVAITFPVAFSYKPVVFLTKPYDGTAVADLGFSVITASGFSIYLSYVGSGTINVDVCWVAIGAL